MGPVLVASLYFRLATNVILEYKHSINCYINYTITGGGVWGGTPHKQLILLSPSAPGQLKQVNLTVFHTCPGVDRGLAKTCTNIDP